MSRKLEDITLRSEQVQEVLTKAPHWLIRFGNLFLLSFSIMLLFLSWLIKYPDVVETPAIIEWQEPPVEVKVKSEGKLTELLIADGTQVLDRQPLAVVGSNADYEQVTQLKDELEINHLINNQLNTPIKEMLRWELGEIYPAFDQFLDTYLVYKAQAQLLGRNNLEQLAPLRELTTSIHLLNESITHWENEHLITAAGTGKISFASPMSPGQQIAAGQRMFSINPVNEGELLLRMQVPGAVLHKVSSGQTVNVDLERYPVADFGKIQASVHRIADRPNANGLFAIEALFDKSSLNGYDGLIKLQADMTGKAEIITADLRLSDRIFQRIKNMFGP